ncbi:MAG: Gfo/Idh/MocA family oxidoreductase [Anaerolineae bacterium]
MLRVGLVGSGLMGATHADAWRRTSAHLAGVYSIDTDGAKRLANQHQVGVYESLPALLNDVDVVDVCTPTHLHHDIALQAAAAGKHVVCEKPLARTMEQARAMIAACEEANVQLLVAHVVRFFPEYALAKAVVERGDIGQVAVIRLTRCSSLPTWATDNWLSDPVRSGGMLLDLMIHDFDYARWVAGDVESVYVRHVRGHNPQKVEDYGIAILRHTSGTISNIEGGWAYPKGMFRTALEIAGDAGLIEHPAGSSVPLAIYRKDEGDAHVAPMPSSPLAEDPYTTEIKHFYDVIENGTVPRVTAYDGLAALRIALAAVKSAASGRSVNVAEVG